MNDPMSGPDPLKALAERAGILSEYVDQGGTETRVTPDETRIAILAAMGIDASTPERARQAIERLDAEADAGLLPPVRVVQHGDADALHVRVRMPEAAAKRAEWRLEFHPEGSEPVHREGTSHPSPDGRLLLRLPEAPEGYHTLRVTLSVEGHEHGGEQLVIVVPARCPTVTEAAGRDRVFGVIANLYTVRSGTDWGIGDFSDLGRLLEWTAGEGGAFVGVNPLHALRNRGGEISPYSPVSRIFRNPIYIDVDGVPGVEASEPARRLMESPDFRAEHRALRASEQVEYERVMGLKRQVLEILFREHGAEDPRFREWSDREGEPLTLYATYESLVAHLGTGDWRSWPERFRDPRSPAVAEFRDAHRSEIDFHRWLQFEADRQLGAAAGRGERAGAAIGLYQDLAIGTSAASADVWANPELFLTGISIGAPPDDYSASGQNWGLPPLDPRALRRGAYRYWIDLVRASLRHGGALRIDHVLGLFRQFWIPDGMDGDRGAYVRFPADDLLGILALEAARHGALVVGEDLGTVPPEVPPALKRWNVLSSRVFYFERSGDRFHAAATYEPMSLATANTHDMPTMAGWWRGRDIELKRELGIIAEDAAERQAAARERERTAMLERLAEDGALPAASEPGSGAELRGAVHAFLCRTPAALVGFSLEDLVGEGEPVNIPGVPPERYSSWTRRLARPLEALSEEPDVRAALRCDGRA